MFLEKNYIYRPNPPLDFNLYDLETYIDYKYEDYVEYCIKWLFSNKTSKIFIYYTTLWLQSFERVFMKYLGLRHEPLPLVL